jgi:hypothetical protein
VVCNGGLISTVAGARVTKEPPPSAGTGVFWRQWGQVTSLPALCALALSVLWQWRQEKRMGMETRKETQVTSKVFILVDARHACPVEPDRANGEKAKRSFAGMCYEAGAS